VYFEHNLIICLELYKYLSEKTWNKSYREIENVYFISKHLFVKSLQISLVKHKSFLLCYLNCRNSGMKLIAYYNRGPCTNLFSVMFICVCVLVCLQPSIFAHIIWTDFLRFRYGSHLLKFFGHLWFSVMLVIMKSTSLNWISGCLYRVYHKWITVLGCVLYGTLSICINFVIWDYHSLSKEDVPTWCKQFYYDFIS